MIDLTILRWGGALILDDLNGPSVIKGPNEKEAGVSESARRCDDRSTVQRETRRCYTTGLDDGRGPEPRSAGRP